MNYRTIELQTEETISADATKVYDINVKQPISSIVLRLNAYATSHTMAAHAMACITSIEIVDGSEVLYSLDGYEAQALDWYNKGGRFRGNWNCCINANGWVTYVGINFGRWEYDMQYAFDPTRYNNPQLKISYDVDAGGGSPTSIYPAIYANLFDEKIPDLRGFLMTKEIKQWTMASGVHNYTDLPTDYPYRAIYLRTALMGTEPTTCLRNFKLSEDQDQKIPFDIDGIQVPSMLLGDYPKVSENYYYHVTASQTYIFVAPANFVTAVGTVWNAAAVNQVFALHAGDGGRVEAICNAGNFNIQVHVEGTLPHAVFQFPCGLKNDPADWYQVQGIGSLRVDITGGAASQGHLFIEQVRPY